MAEVGCCHGGVAVDGCDNGERLLPWLWLGLQGREVRSWTFAVEVEVAGGEVEKEKTRRGVRGAVTGRWPRIPQR